MPTPRIASTRVPLANLLNVIALTLCPATFVLLF
jgi:hypothetical protein